jgi:hypothetical protein
MGSVLLSVGIFQGRRREERGRGRDTGHGARDTGIPKPDFRIQELGDRKQKAERGARGRLRKTRRTREL